MDRRTLSSMLTSVVLSQALPAWTAGPGALSWQKPVEVAEGKGERGPWQQNNSRYNYVDDPAVAIDVHGNTVLAYVDEASKDVFLQRYAADGTKQFSKPVNVSRNPASFSWLPRVLIPADAPNKVYILWQEIIFGGGSHGGDMFFAHSEDGGANFSPAVNLTESVGGEGKGRINKEVWHNGSYDLALGADGTLYAAWTEYAGQLWLTRSIDGGKSFTPRRQVAGGSDDASDAKPARAPALAAGPGHTLYLAWTTGDDEGADIHVARSTDGGEHLDPPILVAPSTSYSDAPRLALDAGGTLHLVYAESDAGPFDRYRVLYTRSVDGARHFEAPRDLSRPLPGKAISAAFPEIELDAHGGVYVTWESIDDLKTRPRGLGMTLSRDGGQRFVTPAIVPGSIDPSGGFNGSYQGLLMKKLAVNRVGSIAVANSSLLQDRASSIWLMRADPTR